MLKNNSEVRRTALSGLMLALSLVIARVITIDTPGLIITFSSIPIAFCAVILGPYYGLGVSVLYDILKVILISGKNYDYVFSFSAAVYGCIIGIAFMRASRKSSPFKLYSILLIAEFLQSTVLNTLFLVFRYGLEPFSLLPIRLFSLAINPIITAYFCYLMIKTSEKIGIVRFSQNTILDE